MPLVSEHMAMLGHPKDHGPSERVIRHLALRLARKDLARATNTRPHRGSIAMALLN